MSKAISSFTVFVALCIFSYVRTQTDPINKINDITSEDLITVANYGLASTENTTNSTFPVPDIVASSEAAADGPTDDFITDALDAMNVTTDIEISSEVEEYGTSSETPTGMFTEESDQTTDSSPMTSDIGTTDISTDEYLTETTGVTDESYGTSEEESYTPSDQTVTPSQSLKLVIGKVDGSTEEVGTTIEETEISMNESDATEEPTEFPYGTSEITSEIPVTDAIISLDKETSLATSSVDNETEPPSTVEEELSTPPETTMGVTKITLVAKADEDVEEDENEEDPSEEDLMPDDVPLADDMPEVPAATEATTTPVTSGNVPPAVGKDDHDDEFNFSDMPPAEPKLDMDMGWIKAKSVQQIYDYVESLPSRYPKTTTLKDIGYTDLGHPIYAIEISHKVYSGATIVIDAGMDATDAVGIAFANYVLHCFLERTTDYLLTITGVTVIVIPLVNADNYKKHLDGHESQACRETLFHDWEAGTPKPSNGCPEQFFYHPETIALSKYYSKIKNLKLYISIGSGTPMISFPYGYQKGLSKRSLKMANNMAKAIDFDKVVPKVKVCPIYDCFERTQGTPVDWQYEYLGTPYSLYLSLRRDLNDSTIGLRMFKSYVAAIQYAILELQLTDPKIARAIYDECNSKDVIFVNTVVFIACTFVIVYYF